MGVAAPVSERHAARVGDRDGEVRGKACTRRDSRGGVAQRPRTESEPSTRLPLVARCLTAASGDVGPIGMAEHVTYSRAAQPELERDVSAGSECCTRPGYAGSARGHGWPAMVEEDEGGRPVGEWLHPHFEGAVARARSGCAALRPRHRTAHIAVDCEELTILQQRRPACAGLLMRRKSSPRRRGADHSEYITSCAAGRG